MARHQLHKQFDVHGRVSLKAGRLTFTTDDPELAWESRRSMESGSAVTISLHDADPAREFHGTVESIELRPGEPPQQWDVVMVADERAKPKRRPPAKPRPAARRKKTSARKR